MKTRRKVTKTPSKGRRSSVICVKKSPINRKNTHRVLRSQAKRAPLFNYESPLKHLRHNGGPASSSSGSTNTATANVIMDEDIVVEDEIEEERPDISNLTIKEEPVEEIDVNDIFTDSESTINTVKVKKDSQTITSSIDIKKDPQTAKGRTEINIDLQSPESSTKSTALSKSKRKVKTDMLTSLQNRKKRKTVKKSPLSRLNESDDKLSESVIIVDDSESLPDTKPVLTDSTKNTYTVMNTSFQEVDQSIVKCEPLSDTLNSEIKTNSDDVVVIDCDSSLMEMEAYHEAFTENQNWSPVNSRFSSNSVIVIDPDDDSPIQTRHTSPKPTENCLLPIQLTRQTIPKPADDCFVVWSSLPHPSTSNAVRQEINKPLPNFNSNLLQCDKILFDTGPDMKNLRFLNNENDKPRKNIKSKQGNVKTKKSLLKSQLPKATKTAIKATKAVTKTTNAVTKITKSAKTASTTTKAATSATKAASTTTKAATATSKTTVKKKTKNKGELIFLSESKEEDSSVKKTKPKKGRLREIVIDGSNVAMAYTKNKTFSEKGIKMLIDYFTKKGHSVKVFIPQYRRSRNFPLLEKWHTEGIVVFTPSRKLGNKTFTPYDDRYILEYATACNGIVVSQDQFRDLYAEKPEYRDTIENRILVPTFVGDYVMFPEDPLGRDGPTLTEFLKY